MTKKVRVTKVQRFVLEALYKVRGADNTVDLTGRFREVEQATIAARKGVDGKETPVGRQQWTDKKTGDVGIVWGMIGEAARGKLSHQHTIEKMIRGFREDPEVEVERLRGETEQLQVIIKDLEDRAKTAEAERDAVKKEYADYVEKFRADQGTEAHFKINYQRTLNDNIKKTEEINTERDITRGLRVENSRLEGLVNNLEAQLSELSGGMTGDVISIKQPDFIEPKISDSDITQEPDELLVKYENAVDDALAKLKKLAIKKPQPNITIVFHAFNDNIKALYKGRLIPLKSASADNIVFGVGGFDKGIRKKVYEEARALAKSDPLIVHVSGTSFPSIPVQKRTNQSDHEWFVELVKSNEYPRDSHLTFSPFREGYDSVVFRRLGNEH